MRIVAAAVQTYYTHTMKNILLCSLNARYSHSSLALRCLKAAAQTKNTVSIAEHSINERVPDIVDSIVRRAPDAAGFSCYIWNIEQTLKIASTVGRILPHCFIFFGGPEVSFDSAAIMRMHPFIDMIIRGPGEVPFAHLMACFDGEKTLDATPSACIRRGEDILTTDDAPPFDLSHQPFLYGDLSDYQNRVIYYETSRGCPYRCAYCMSAGQPLSFLPIARVQKELEHFLRANVHQVKLVDRTFNHPADRAYEILSTLITLSKKYPESSARFHFEISANLLDDKTLALLRRARPGLIQFEVGIQSTNPATLCAVNRHHDTQKLLRRTHALCGLNTVHVHADLIAGLPLETPETFAQSFNDAYALGADALQLGFLKMLPGAPIRDMAEEYGIIYTSYPPYEVLKTQTMSYQALSHLHRIARLVDIIYNTHHFNKTLPVLLSAFDTPYALFDALAAYLDARGYLDRPHKIAALFDALGAFAADTQKADTDMAREALVFDWLCLEKPKTWPPRLFAAPTPEQNAQRHRFFGDRDAVARWLPAYASLPAGRIASRCRIHTFHRLFGAPAAVLFDYGKQRGDTNFWQIIGPV